MATATLISFACRALQLPYVRTYQSRQPMQARRAGELPIRIRGATPCIAPWVVPRGSCPVSHLLLIFFPDTPHASFGAFS